MIVKLPTRQEDDPVFAAALEGLVGRLMSECAPAVVYVVRVGKWFDHKWLRYSGRGRVQFSGFGIPDDTALDEHWQDQLTFPPFNPKQIVAQVGFVRRQGGKYANRTDKRWLHKPVLQHSASNLQNRVSAFSPSGLYVWFSSFTEKNGVGAVMVYSVDEGRELAWYASFRREGGWAVEKTKGAPRKEVQECFPLE